MDLPHPVAGGRQRSPTARQKFGHGIVRAGYDVISDNGGGGVHVSVAPSGQPMEKCSSGMGAAQKRLVGEIPDDFGFGAQRDADGMVRRDDADIAGMDAAFREIGK